MSTELVNQGTVIPGEAAPVAPAPVETAPQIGTEGVESAPPAAADDTEARARAQGWVPKEEFRGPPENWRDAAAFVKRGEEEVPIMRERLRALERKLAEKDTQFTALERMSQIALQRQREQLAATYQAAMRDAVAVGDVQRYDQLNGDMAQALHQHDKRLAEQIEPLRQPQQQGQPNDPELATWVQQNTWFQRDPALQHAIIGEARALEAQYPGMSVMDTIRHAEQAVRRRYADKFGPSSGQATPLQAERPRALTFEGGSRVAGGGPRPRGAAELPAEARRAGERFVKEGIFKDLNAYAKDYFAQEGV